MLIAHVLGDSRWWYKKQACRGFRVWKQAFFAAAIEVDLDAKKTLKTPQRENFTTSFNCKTIDIGAQRPRFALWEAKFKSEDAYASFRLVKYSLEVGKL